MAEKPDWSLHATVNQYGDDVSLRVSVTAYGENGVEFGTQTWRGRDQRLPELPSSIDTAWFLLCLLVRVTEKEGAVGRINARIDESLF